MPANRPRCRGLAALAVALLLAALLIVPVAAESFDERLHEIDDTTLTMQHGYGNVQSPSALGILVNPAEAFDSVELKALQKNVHWQPSGERQPPFTSSDVRALTSYAWEDIPLRIEANRVGTATLGFFRYGADLEYCRIYAQIHDLDLTGYTGEQWIKFDFAGYPISGEMVRQFYSLKTQVTYDPATPTAYLCAYPANPTVGTATPGYGLDDDYSGVAIVWNEWYNDVHYDNESYPTLPGYASVSVLRGINGTNYLSQVWLTGADGSRYYNGVLGVNDLVAGPLPPSALPLTLTVKNPTTDTIFTRILGDDGDPGPDPSPDNTPVTIYVQNSQTGALLADARLSILAAAGGTETEVVNATLPGGTGTYTLQPTGGGLPNPDYYRAVATVPGFSQIIENHSFTLNGPHDVIIEMRPDTGGPLDPNLSYLEFYVRDIHANPISSASVQCDGRIKTTNSQGYAVFEVSKNATYPYVAKKSGYVTIEGTATVADGPRYVANVVLGPGTVPTHTPTLGPGGPGATPTPDTRTNEQKGQSVIDLIADFAEPIAILAILATIFGLMKMMTPGRR